MQTIDCFPGTCFDCHCYCTQWHFVLCNLLLGSERFQSSSCSFSLFKCMEKQFCRWNDQLLRVFLIKIEPIYFISWKNQTFTLFTNFFPRMSRSYYIYFQKQNFNNIMSLNVFLFQRVFLSRCIISD